MKTVKSYIGTLVLILGFLSLSTSSFSQHGTESLEVLNVTDLINFSGDWDKSNVNLECKLADDHRIIKIYIERANGAGIYQKISEINTVGTRGFRFNDPNAAKGKNLYRLVLYKADNRYAYSKILKIDNIESTDLSFEVYPTVVRGSATVSVGSIEAHKATIQITNMNGQVVNQSTIAVQQGTMVTDLKGANKLSPGTYIVTLIADTQKLVQRIIVQ